MRLLRLLICVVTVVATIPFLMAADEQPRRNKCTGSSSCKACENCNSCKHCSKEGGSCSVKREDELRERRKEREAQVDRREERRQQREERKQKRRGRRERRRQRRN